MKITRSRLQQIIKEEVARELKEYGIQTPEAGNWAKWAPYFNGVLKQWQQDAAYWKKMGTPLESTGEVMKFIQAYQNNERPPFIGLAASEISGAAEKVENRKHAEQAVKAYEQMVGGD